MLSERSSLKTVPQSDRSFEEYQNQAPIVSSSEATGAAFDLAWRDSLVGLYARSNAVDELNSNGMTPLSAEEANKQFPGMAEPFREPVNPVVAQFKYDQQAEVQDLQRKMSQGPNDSWTQSKMFGAGLAAHMLDPVEFGAGAMVGWAVGGAAAAGLLGQGAKTIATGAAAEGAGLGTRLAFDAIEGAGGAFIENVGQEIIQKGVEDKEGIVNERSAGEIATDVLIGTVAAFGMQAIPKSVARGVDLGFEGTRRFFRNTSPEADLPVARHIISSSERGTLPDITPLTHAISKETDVPGSVVNYEYRPLDTPKGKTFYVATRDAAVDAPRVPLGDDFGFGTHLTDHPGVANAAGARSMADGVGTVSEVNVDSLTPLRLDQPLPNNLREPIKDLMKKVDAVDALNFDELSTKDILIGIRNAVDAGLLAEEDLLKVKGILQQGGYDSLISDGKSFNGIEHTPHNNVILLDDTKIKAGKTYDANPEFTRKPTPEELDAARMKAENPKRFLGDEDRYEKNFEGLRQESIESLDPDLQKQFEEGLEDLIELEKQGGLDADEVKLIETLKTDKLNAEDRFTALKAFKLCTMRG